MRKPSKEKKVRRIGGTIVASVDEISRVKLNQHLNLDMVSAPVEASVDPELKEARAKMSAAKKAFMADPSVENKREAKAARELFEKVEYTHFLEMDKDKAIRQVRNKMMSMELKAEDLKRKIQGQKMVRLDCQARGDGKGIMKCDQQTMKFEGQCALAIHEGDRYRVMLGHVISGDRTGVTFSESEDFAQVCERPDGSVYGTTGQCRKGKPTTIKPEKKKRVEGTTHRKKVGLGVRIRNAQKKGDKSLEAKLKEERMALSIKQKAEKKVEPVKDRKAVKLKGEKEVLKDAKANEKRVQPQEPDRKPKDEAAKPAAKAQQGTAKARKLYEKWDRSQLEEHKKFIQDAAKERANNSPMQRAAKQQVKAIDSVLKEKNKTDDTTGFPEVKGRRGFDAEKASRQAGAKTIGAGAMGSVTKVKGPPPAIIKRGEIGQFEAKALEVLKGSGVAPELYGQTLGKEREKTVGGGLGGHVKGKSGFLGMSEAKGGPLMATRLNQNKTPEALEEKRKIMEAYVEARKEIHTRGVAHNDLHAGNFFYDKKTGKGSMVDFGLSQVSPKAALAEGLGLVSGMDWQGERIKARLKGHGSEKYETLRNNARAVSKAIANDYSIPKSRQSMIEGIRKRQDDLDSTGISDKDAMKYINMLYEGI